MKFRRKIKLFIVLMLSIMTASSALAVTNSIYAVSVDNTNIYEIDVTTGAVTPVTTSSFASISLACDGTYAYYWNTENPSHRGLTKWDPLTNSHTLIDATDVSEENATVDSLGNIWILDTTRSYVDGSIGTEDTCKLYKVDKTNGDRIDTYTLPDVGGYATGDIAWGPDGKKLYISTDNPNYGYGNDYNYVWDRTDPTNIVIKGGVYYAGLVWVNDKLYGSRANLTNGTGVIYELNPTDFSEIALVATMPLGVTAGDLSNAVPEPATICLLGLASIALFKKQKRK